MNIVKGPIGWAWVCKEHGIRRDGFATRDAALADSLVHVKKVHR